MYLFIPYGISPYLFTSNLNIIIIFRTHLISFIINNNIYIFTKNVI